jgi:hypothetical protein
LDDGHSLRASLDENSTIYNGDDLAPDNQPSTNWGALRQVTIVDLSSLCSLERMIVPEIAWRFGLAWLVDTVDDVLL